MDTLPIINRTYELYKWIAKTNYGLEKRWRYTLGQSIENSILNLLEYLIMAKNAPKNLKIPYLIKAISYLGIVRLKLRLLLELDLVNATRIFQAQKNLEEIGRMLGGWQRSIN